MDPNNKETQEPLNNVGHLPGSVIMPEGKQPVQSAVNNPPVSVSSPSQVAQTLAQPVVVVSQQPFEPTVTAQQPTAFEAGDYKSKSELIADENGFQWIGPEFIAHAKSPVWYIILLIFTGVVAGGFYFLTKDLITATVIVIAMFCLGFYSSRKPKNIEYRLNENGFQIGTKQLDYQQFRCFTVAPGGDYLCITLIPFKRFSPPSGIYYFGEQEDEIIDYIAEKIPYQEHKAAFIDIIMDLIHF